MLRYAAAGSISAYQKWLSPRKGFCCAFGKATGQWTCSSYAKRIVSEHGTLALAKAMPRQFARCRSAQARLLAIAAAGAAAAIPTITQSQSEAGETGEEEARKKEASRWSWDVSGLCDTLNCAGDVGNSIECGSCACDGW
jgi:putative component of membrane protein insertase Oxa1/YidC/SpoIIIJ protein YidD